MLGVPAAPSGTAELPAKALNGATRISNAAAKCFHFKAVQERNGRAVSAAGFKPPSRHVLPLSPVSRVLGRVLFFFPPAKSVIRTRLEVGPVSCGDVNLYNSRGALQAPCTPRRQGRATTAPELPVRIRYIRSCCYAAAGRGESKGAWQEMKSETRGRAMDKRTAVTRDGADAGANTVNAPGGLTSAGARSAQALARRESCREARGCFPP